eukprot:1117226-Amphidinium_carterae.2
MKWPTWELPLMLRMSPAAKSSKENALKPGRGYGSLPRLKRRQWCPPWLDRGSHNHKPLM